MMTSKIGKAAEDNQSETRRARVGHSLTKPEAGRQASKAELEHRWRAEHTDAIRAENDYMENHGLPLSKYRLF